MVKTVKNAHLDHLDSLDQRSLDSPKSPACSHRILLYETPRPPPIPPRPRHLRRGAAISHWIVKPHWRTRAAETSAAGDHVLAERHAAERVLARPGRCGVQLQVDLEAVGELQRPHASPAWHCQQSRCHRCPTARGTACAATCARSTARAWPMGWVAWVLQHSWAVHPARSSTFAESGLAPWRDQADSLQNPTAHRG